MLKRNTFLILSLVLLINPLFAGKAADRVEKGKKYREKHPNEKFVATTMLTHITFDKKKGKRGLTTDNYISCTTTTNAEIISLTEGFTYSENIYYSQAVSSVRDIFYSLNKKKKLLPYTSDNAYQDNDIFHHDIRFKKFSFKVGDLGQEAKFQYTEQLNNVKYLSRLFFNSGYKVEQKTIIIDVPDYLNLDLREFNFDGFNIAHVVEDISKKKKKITRHTYVIKGGEKLKEEYMQSNIAFNYPHIVMVPKFFIYKGEQKNIFNEAKDLYKWYNYLTKELEYGNSEYKNFTLELIKDCKTENEKIKKIYYWVQDNIRYIAFEDGIAGFKPDQAHNVFKNKYGDCKGMANLSKAMLKIAGFDARLAWLGTSSLPYDYSLPSLCVDNHMICALQINDNWLYIDGTEKFQTLKTNAYRIRGKQVMIQNGDNDPIINTIPKNYNSSDAFVQKLTLELTEKSMEGKGKVTLKGDEKRAYLYYVKYSPKSSLEKIHRYYFAKDNPMVSISNLDCKNCVRDEAHLEVSYDLKIRNKITAYDEEIYLEYEFNKEFNDFKEDKNRVTDLDFNNYCDIALETTFTHPTKWKVTHLPSTIDINNEDFRFYFKISAKGRGSLVYEKIFKIKQGKIKVQRYEEFKNAMVLVREFYDDQVTFTK
ncbi:MAG: hypothetical protein ACJA0Q_000960 [Saprospiraceae bacterium]|jgi:hypothetical protein